MPLLHLGVEVVFFDVEPDTGNIDAKGIEPLVTERTKALVTNHMWGHPVDVEAVGELCRRHGLAWIEDCSHAHFAEHDRRHVGIFGDVSVFSLQGNKLLTGGEGGVLLTDSTEIYERATLLGHSLKRSQQCVKSGKWQPITRTGFGLKLRMHPLAAVMVSHLLEHYYFDWIERRRERLVETLKAEGLKVSVPGSPPFHKLALFDPERFQVGHFVKHDPAKGRSLAPRNTGGASCRCRPSRSASSGRWRTSTRRPSERC